MAANMSRQPDTSGKKPRIPGYAVVIAGVVGLNIIATFNANLAVMLAGGVIVIAAMTFFSALLRRK